MWSFVSGIYANRYGEVIIDVIFTYIIASCGFWVLRYSLHQFFQRTSFIDEKKEGTIESVVKNTSKYLTLILVLITAIQPFVDWRNILVAGGVLTAIVGFGAQSAIKDFLYGFFFLFEGQLKKGDFVTINNELAGAVEELGFRAVSVRLTDGRLMTVPNGEVLKVINGNVNHRRVFESVIIDFKEDPARVRVLLESLCEELNELHMEYLLRDTDGEFVEAYHYWGLSSLDASPYGFKFSIVATVQDVHYLQAAQEAKFRLAKRLHEEGILLPSIRAVYAQQ
ncbi:MULTISPECIES: mechanosensitive ion channel family protein [Bacillaceae]|jgi:small conductance mechanosensitive channel|uniref:mechanosensitive ion channel family protein n=1 Tax=Bacillaceae TaxID=186817 RepID=UPI00101DE9D0|nr:mechanosensitive ion channel domain-containing protein [Ectobacillus funiculus]